MKRNMPVFLGKEKIRERNFVLGVVSDLKEFFSNLANSLVRKEIFRVRIENERLFYQPSIKINRQLDGLAGTLGRYVEEITQLGTSLQRFADKISERGPEYGKEMSKLTTSLQKIAALIAGLKFPEPPKIQKITGDVNVSKLPEIYDFEKMTSILDSINNNLKNFRVEIPPFPKIPEVKIPTYPKEVKIAQAEEILDSLKELNRAIKELPNKIPKPELPESISINNWPPQKVPQPVTNININPLRGDFKTTAVTVTTTPTALPTTPLENRRALIVYNNSSSTIYLGGGSVTASNGLPLEASSYSPPFDAGVRMTLYGIVSSGTANVRVLEISNDAIGG